MGWDTKRKGPYTAAGIIRCKCVRCGEPALYQWQICSDGNNYRPVCEGCDIALNAAVLRFMRHPRHKAVSTKYRDALRKKAKPSR